MSRFYIVILIVFSIISCNSSVESKCEDYLLTNLDDPSTYQRVQISIIDTITRLENLENYYNEMFPAPAPAPEVPEPLSAEEDSLLNLINSIKLGTIKNKIEKYNYQIKYRVKNDNGNLGLYIAIISYWPNSNEDKFKLISITKFNPVN